MLSTPPTACNRSRLITLPIHGRLKRRFRVIIFLGVFSARAHVLFSIAVLFRLLLGLVDDFLILFELVFYFLVVGGMFKERRRRNAIRRGWLNVALPTRWWGRFRSFLAHRLPLSDRNQYLPSLGAVVLADDLILRHEVDQPRRAAIPNAERPLQQRYAAAPLANHHIDRLLVQLVAMLEAPSAAGRVPSRVL